MITLEGTLGVKLTDGKSHSPYLRELLPAILASVLTLLASYIKDVIPLKGPLRMLLTNRHCKAFHT